MRHLALCAALLSLVACHSGFTQNRRVDQTQRYRSPHPQQSAAADQMLLLVLPPVAGSASSSAEQKLVTRSAED